MDCIVEIMPPVFKRLQTPQEWRSTRSKYDVAVVIVRGIAYAVINSSMFGAIWWFDMAGRLIWRGEINDPEDFPEHLRGPATVQPREQWQGIVLALIDALLCGGARVYHNVAATGDCFWFRRNRVLCPMNRVIAIAPSISKLTWAIVDQLADGTAKLVDCGEHATRASDALGDRILSANNVTCPL